MRKKNYFRIIPLKKNRKLLNITKIYVLITLLSVFSVFSENTYSQSNLVTLKLTNVTMEEAIENIEKNTGYMFLIMDNAETELRKRVNIDFDNKSINEILDILLKDTVLSYNIVKNQITIKRKIQPTVVSEKTPFSSEVVQQTRKTIRGTVVDTNGEAIIGANIVEKGTTNGTVTDIDGNFYIQVTQGAIIQISYIGYLSQEIATSDRITFSIILREDTKALDEVVVIGYGETTRGDLTGSVSSIKGKTLVRTGVSSFSEALQGRIAGVHVNMQSGEPGSAVNIQIRGSNSINASTSPLYVIDGMQMDVNESEVATSDVGGYTRYNPLASINPNDIESLEVLKDASATAIFGARGANGVIIITTKSGKTKKPRINLDVSYGMSEAPKRLKMLEPQDYLEYRFLFGSGSEIWGQDLNGDGVADIPYNADNYSVYNWQDLLLRKGYTQKYNLSVQQGSESLNYLFGVGYDKQGGVVQSNDYSRISANMRINAKVSDKMEIGMSGNYGQTSTEGAVSSGGGTGSFNGLIQSMYTEKPIGIYVPEENEGTGQYTPLTTMFFDSYKNVAFNSVHGNVFAQYELMPGLNLRISGSGRNTFSKMQEFYGKETRWGKSSNGRAGIQDVRTVSFTQSNTLTYNNRINNHYLTAMIGQETNSYKSANANIKAYDFEDETTGVFDLAKGNSVDKPTTYTYKVNRLSYFGRFNYNIDSKYYFTATFRADGSSNFGSGNRFGYFPSGAFSWRINNESFLNDVKEISNLRLRLSYGITGNDRMSAYAALARLGIQNYASNGKSLYGMAPIQSPNPRLKWESTAQANIGVDFGLFDERFTLTTDIYKKHTNDMLLSTPIPSQTGYSRQMQNIGSVENKGFELSISSVNIDKKDFSWRSTLNFDLNRNKVLSLGDAQFLPVTIGNGHLTDVGRVIVGQPIGTGFGYIADGNYQLDDFIITNYVGDPANIENITERNLHLYNYQLKEGVTSIAGVNLKPGDRKYRDLNGDNVINAEDRTVISDGNPNFNIGFSNQFRYKQFDLGFFFEGVFGNEIMNDFIHRSESGLAGSAPVYNLTQDYYLNRWTPKNPSNTYSSIKNGTNGFVSTYYVEDGSFIRFKNLSLGYTFDQSFLTKAQINHLRLSLTMDNLFVWTKYSGLDPDVRSSNSLMPGYDRLSYPRARTFLLGLNVEF